MPSKDGTMDDNKKSTKDVVNKKQKQMLNQEYIPEEEYDHYRDRIAMAGGDHRSKETRERSNTPTGKQPKGKTVYQKQAEKKYGKGKSALDMVKADITAKYGKGAIMDVKKKEKKKNAAKTAREELDLTQVAEAFGGHIIGKPVELNEDGGVLTIPATAAAIKYGIPAALAIGAGAYDYYKKRKGEKGIFPDMSKILSNVFAIKKINKKITSNSGDNTGDSTSDTNNVKVDKTKKNVKVDKTKKNVKVDKKLQNTNKVDTNTNTNTNKKINKKLQNTNKVKVNTNKKVKPKEINKKLKTIEKNKKVDTNVDSKPNVTDNPLKDALTKVDKKTLQKIGGVGAGSAAIGFGVNQAINNSGKPSTATELVPNQIKNKKKTVVTTKDNKKKKSKFKLPGVPRLDTGTIGQRTAG